MITLERVSEPVKPATKAESKKRAEALKELQGEWKVVALEADGAKEPADALAKMRWVVKGTRLDSTDSGDNEQVPASIKLDPGKNPGHIDLLILEGNLKGQQVQGIYKLEKGRWTLCLRDRESAVKDRPAEFSAEKGGGLALISLERAR
jgi:uncharacterized protein (TIGR03067 family)